MIGFGEGYLPPQQAKEQVLNSGFSTKVLERQEAWRKHKNKPYKEFSQAIDLPLDFQKISSLLLLRICLLIFQKS